MQRPWILLNACDLIWNLWVKFNQDRKIQKIQVWSVMITNAGFTHTHKKLYTCVYNAYCYFKADMSFWGTDVEELMFNNLIVIYSYKHIPKR